MTPRVSVRRCTDGARLHSLKQAYLDRLTAPMDGMWERELIARAPHWEVAIDDHLSGFGAVSDDGVLLQLFLEREVESLGSVVLDRLRSTCGLRSAVVSTGDPDAVALCTAHASEATLRGWVFELSGPPTDSDEAGAGALMTLVDEYMLESVVSFQLASLREREGQRTWLSEYSGRLVRRGELYLLELGDDWLGVGEFRRSDSQPGVVDLGMMVAAEWRGRGWATEILRRLARLALKEGLRPICSTTEGNVASRRAIERAGFVARQRVLDFRFDPVEPDQFIDGS